MEGKSRQDIIKEALLYNLSENAKEVQFEFKQNGESKKILTCMTKFFILIFFPLARKPGNFRDNKFILLNSGSNIFAWLEGLVPAIYDKYVVS